MYDYTLMRKKRKTLSMKLDKDGNIIISAPLRYPQAMIDDFVRNNAQWIDKKRVELQNRKPLPIITFSEGEEVPLLGKTYQLHLYDGKKTGLVEDSLYLSADAPKERLIRFYRDITRKVVTPLLEKYAACMHIQYKGLSVTSAKSRWGSCNGKNSISFSFYLAMCDPFAVEYVVVHELCHILQKNHSKLFWSEVEKYFPAYLKAKKYLKDKAFYMAMI